MLSNSNITDILAAARGVDESISDEDVLFLVLLDNYGDRGEAYYLAYRNRKIQNNEDIDDFLASKRMRALIEAAKPFGVGAKDANSISRDENQSALIQLLSDIDDAMSTGDMDRGAGLKLQADIRVKLQDKFEMDEDKDEEKHIIVVPQKHDYICPHTSRECSKMPSKDACMKYYGLVDGDTSVKSQSKKSQLASRREDVILDVSRDF